MANKVIRLDRMTQCYRDAVNQVYTLAHSVGTTDQAQLIRALQDVEDDAHREGSTGQETIRRLIAVIYDLLAFGNLPPQRDVRQLSRIKPGRE